MLSSEQRLDILYPAARAENLRLVDQLHRVAAVTPLREEFPERFGTMVSVDHKRSHAGGDQVVEHEGDERFLENRDKGFWQIFGQRTEPHPEPGAENKRLRDHLLRLLGGSCAPSRDAEIMAPQAR